MAFDLPYYSRFVDSDPITWDGSRSFGIYKNEVLDSLKTEDLIRFKVESGFAGRPDLIANEVYGTPYYAWVIVMYNKPLNPIGWPNKGTSILIPNNSAIDRIIFE